MLGGKKANAAFWWEEEDGCLRVVHLLRSAGLVRSLQRPETGSEILRQGLESLCRLSAEELAEMKVEDLDLGPLRASFPHVFRRVPPSAGGALLR